MVRIEIDPAAISAWEALSAEHPLPAGFKVMPAAESAADSATEPRKPASTKLIATIELLHYQPAEDAAERSQRTEEETLLIEQRYFVPAVPMWDPRNNIEMNSVKETGIVPLEDLSLPYKALPVDGMHIDSADYPLVEQKILSLTWEELQESDTEAAELRSWYENLRSEYRSPAEIEPMPIAWIGGVGDIMVQRGVQSLLIGKGRSGLQTVFQNTLPVLQRQDLLIGNLEGAVTNRGLPTPKSYNFRFSPDVLPALKSAGFDYFSITNNHCYDFGTTGFTDTLTHLEAHGLLTSGAGRTPKAAYTPARSTIHGTDVTVLSVGAYPQERNGFDGRRQAQVTEERPGIVFSGRKFLDTVAEISSEAGIDIVVAHGGQEWSSRPTAEQRRFYRACIEAGADLVLAHHPHVLQGMEAFKDGLIAYSLGNFIFPGMYVMPNAEQSLILSTGYYGSRLVYIEPHPVKINNRVIDLDAPDGPVLARFLKLTEQLHHESR
ncbi:MAG: CapA family protein [Spirochaetota bacterium]